MMVTAGDRGAVAGEKWRAPDEDRVLNLGANSGRKDGRRRSLREPQPAAVHVSGPIFSWGLWRLTDMYIYIYLSENLCCGRQKRPRCPTHKLACGFISFQAVDADKCRFVGTPRLTVKQLLPVHYGKHMGQSYYVISVLRWILSEFISSPLRRWTVHAVSIETSTRPASDVAWRSLYPACLLWPLRRRLVFVNIEKCSLLSTAVKRVMTLW